MDAFMAQAADMQIFRLPSRTLVRRQASACGLLHGIVAVLAITLVGNSIAYGQDAAPPPPPTKATLLQIGVGNRVKVKEADGTKVKGTVLAVHDDSFVVLPKNGGTAVTIPYSQEGEVNRWGLSRGHRIAIDVVVGVVVVLGILIAIAFHENSIGHGF